MAPHSLSASEVAASVAASRGAPTDLEHRIGHLVERFAALDDGAGVDAFVVTDLLNIRYLTGFTGGAAKLVVTDREATLITDGRYGVLASDEVGPAIRVEVAGDDGRRAAAAAIGAAKRIALEADAVTWTQMRAFADEWFAGRDMVATVAVIERLRHVKDDGEIARIRAAAAVADHVLQSVAPVLDDRPSEQDVQRLLDERASELGSEQPAFPTIVASGANAALPHHRPGNRTIVAGDLVLIDFGATIDGYRSDLSRTVVVGDAPAEAVEMFDIVLEAQLAALGAVRDGVAAADVDRAARSVIERAGRGEQFVHSTGHGVGLYIHEDPFVSHRSSDRLARRNVITIEPGIYVAGVGGVRTEDLVVVTDDGYDLLSHTPKTINLEQNGSTP